MKITGKLMAINKDYTMQKDKLTIVINEKLDNAEMQNYFDKPLEIKLDVAKKKRSLNANGYAWALLGELQEKLRTPKEDIYKEYVRRCGPFEVIPIRNDAVSRFIETWKGNGIGYVCDVTKSKINGYTNVLAYYGSSSYDTKEMGLLLETIVEDCIDLGIPTKRKEEIESLLKEWK